MKAEEPVLGFPEEPGAPGLGAGLGPARLGSGCCLSCRRRNETGRPVADHSAGYTEPGWEAGSIMTFTLNFSFGMFTFFFLIDF